MKYFFLAEGWTLGRIWDASGPWLETAHRRKPQIDRVDIGIVEQNEAFWLYRVEEAVVMVEVRRASDQSQAASQNIAQVVLKRLIGPAEVIERMSKAEQVFNGVERPVPASHLLY